MVSERGYLRLRIENSAAETKVPARGKALVPTDLSIAIPEGTYARIGNVDSLITSKHALHNLFWAIDEG